MGQGTESCGGYEIEDSPYADGLATRTWWQRNGIPIQVSEMSLKHLYGAKAVAQRAIQRAVFSCDRNTFCEWVDIFTDEISSRSKSTKTKTKSEPFVKKPTKVKMRCHCGRIYQARQADLDRGWGLSCSKSCAASRREFGFPKARPVKG